MMFYAKCEPFHSCLNLLVGSDASVSHLTLVLHICVCELGQHWFRWWLVAYSAQSHYLKQCCVIVNWTLRNKLLWNFIKIQNFSNTKIAFENIVCETVAILSRGRWVNILQVWRLCNCLLMIGTHCLWTECDIYYPSSLLCLVGNF